MACWCLEVRESTLRPEGTLRTIVSVDARAAARAWVDAWSRAWRALDADSLAPIYTADTVHRSHPFREPGNPIDRFVRHAALLEPPDGAPFHDVNRLKKGDNLVD